MQDLTQSGMITTRFGVPTGYVAINPGGTVAAPVWQVINYVTGETVTIAAAGGAAGTVTGFVAHGARTTVTVGGTSGGILNDAIAAARALDGTGSVTAFLGPTAAAPQEVELLAVTSGGTQYLYAARPAGSGLSIFEVGTGGTLTARGGVADTATTYAAGVTSMVSASVGGVTYVYTASATEHGITAYAVGAGGALTAVDRDGPAEGTPVQGVSALKAVAVGGATFLLAAAAGSSSLSVFRVGADGAPVIVDHLIDDLGTRFDGALVMDTLVTDGRAFIAVAGADDGISLFTLDPGGMLIHLCTVVDGNGASLQNLSALRLAVVGGEVQCLAASSAEAGLTVLRVDLSAAGPLLTGTAGLTGTLEADMLAGGAGAGLIDGAGGDDILIDGAGQDSLRGGAGRDVFVAAFDQTRDVILDFDPAQDRLDLSRWPFLRDATQLTVEVTATGAILSYLGETLEIVTASGQPLSAAELAALPILPATRVHLGAVPGDPGNPGGDLRSGTGGNDTIEGGGGQDTLIGHGGDDVLLGRGGPDLFYGGDGWDTVSYIKESAGIILNLGFPGENTSVAVGDAFSSIEAFVGTNFADRLRGNAQANHLSGANGDDEVEGFAGNDTLQGGEGRDTLRGMDGHDVLDGGAGDDRLEGGARDDTLTGGAGLDVFLGGEGADVVSYADEAAGLGIDRSGGANAGAAAGETYDAVEGWWLGQGDDWFRGGAAGEEVLGGGGADLLEGFDGADRLDGGDGADTLSGGTGNDTLLGGGDDDLIAAADGDDSIDGGSGADNIGGGSGRDLMRGGEGNDTFGGGPGDDTVHGDAGDDYLSGGPDNDRLHGGDGNDGFSGSFGADWIDGGAGNDDLGGGAGKDTLDGGAGNDTLGAGDGDDLLYGGTGDDFVAAGAGRDTLYGGDGIDRLVPGAGDDALWGGAGADTFVFSGWTAGESDLIYDFEDGIDRINAQGVAGASNAARLAALAPAEVWIDGVPHVQFGLNGHVVQIADMTLAQLGTGDFIFT